MTDRFKFRVWDNEAERFCDNRTIDALGLLLHPTGVMTFQCGQSRFPSAIFEPVFEQDSTSKNPPTPPYLAPEQRSKPDTGRGSD